MYMSTRNETKREDIVLLPTRRSNTVLANLHRMMHEPNLIDIHFRRSLLLLLLLLLRPRIWRLRPTLWCLRTRAIGCLHLGRLGLGLGQDWNREINGLLPLLYNIPHPENRILILGPLGLLRDLILEPLLNGRTFLHDRRLVLVINVRVLVVGRGRLGKVVIERRLEFGNGARTFFGFGPARDDGVANGFEPVEASDVGGFGSVFAFFRVEPVLGFLEKRKEFGFFGGLDIGGVTALEFVAGIVDVFFEGVFAVLRQEWISRGACMRS